MRSARYITVVAVVVAVGVRSRQACARRQIPIPDRLVLAAARELLAVGTEAHGSDEGRMPPQGSLYFGRCNVNDLHRAVAASSGDGVTTWAETDAVDPATDVLRRLYYVLGA